MEKKVCSKCKEEKDVTEFNSGRNQCKSCKRKYERIYYQNNKDKKKGYLKEYYNNNIDKIKEYQKEYYNNNIDKIKEKDKEYYYNNKESIKEKRKELHNNNVDKRKKYLKEYDNYKRLTNPIYKLKQNIRRCINYSLKNKGYYKKSKSYKILGCTYNEFKLQIESQWEEWMNWDNYGKYNGEEKYGWDLDHIIPISSGKCEEDIIRLNHHSNIQPLCSYINRYVKRDKIEKGISNVFDIVV